MPLPRAKTRVLTVPKSIAKSAENKLNKGRRLLRETRVTQSKRIMPTGLRCASCRAGQEDWLVARYGAPHCADDGPRFIKRTRTLLAPATQLSVMQDGDCIWGSEFGERRRGNPGSNARSG